MSQNSPDGIVKAVLGPTNTGKTHLAIERMCGHSSGMIGFPLRLLARDVMHGGPQTLGFLMWGGGFAYLVRVSYGR